MKMSKLIYSAIIITLTTNVAIWVHADCQDIYFGDNCGGKENTEANCANACIIKYYVPDGPSSTCTSLDEANDCGWTACTSNKVIVYVYETYETPTTDASGNCNGCTTVGEIVGEPLMAGFCQQDYIPDDADQCGNCG